METALVCESRTVTNKLYSREAPISPDHAVYSSHLIPAPFVGKAMWDCCNICLQHEGFHRENDLGCKARETSEVFEEAGLITPYWDSSDYCITNKGHIIFFEIEEVDTSRLRHHVEGLSLEDGRRRSIQQYIDRYEKAVKMG